MQYLFHSSCFKIWFDRVSETQWSLSKSTRFQPYLKILLTLAEWKKTWLCFCISWSRCFRSCKSFSPICCVITSEFPHVYSHFLFKIRKAFKINEEEDAMICTNCFFMKNSHQLMNFEVMMVSERLDRSIHRNFWIVWLPVVFSSKASQLLSRCGHVWNFIFVIANEESLKCFFHLLFELSVGIRTLYVIKMTKNFVQFSFLWLQIFFCSIIGSRFLLTYSCCFLPKFSFFVSL